MKDLYEYLDYLDNCSDGQFLKFVDAMEKRGYKFVTQYVHDYDYPHVTHCKDCKYRITANCERFGIKRYTQSDSFCSWAEPKDTTEEVRKQLKDMEQRREMDRKK